MSDTATESVLKQQAEDLSAVVGALYQRFGESAFTLQRTAEGLPTLWLQRQSLLDVLRYLRRDYQPRFEMLLDITAIDERVRVHREGQPEADFTVVYHLISFTGNCDVRLKIALHEHDLNVPSAIPVWPSANWYEREVWDMFGISFDGHPNLRRILCPPTWQGHALRKDHPARATEMEPYSLDDDIQDQEQSALKFRPEEWGMKQQSDSSEFMFLNLGPNHPSVHGVFRICLLYTSDAADE